MSPAKPKRAKPLEAAVKREIAAAQKRQKGAGQSWEAKLAITLAQQIEASRDAESLSARVSAAKVLTDTMERIKAIGSEQRATDGLDQLAAARAKRQKAAAR